MLASSPSLIPEEFKDEMVNALTRLEEGDGHTPPLLVPYREAGKGLNPSKARYFEGELTRWVAWESGRSGTVSGARAKVMLAANVSYELVESWRRDFVNRYKDKTIAQRELDDHREKGAAGQPYLNALGHEVTLEQMCQEWRVARTPAKARPRKI
jgi:hypothetical protein